MKKLITPLIDFFIPRICPVCNTNLNSSEDTVCFQCFDQIAVTDQVMLDSEYRRKFAGSGYITDFTSLFIFEKEGNLQYIIHELKYRQKFRIGLFIGKILGERLKDKLLFWQIDYIIPIPLHHIKRAERGFNQSFYIAKGLSKTLNKSVKGNFVKRRIYTKSQTNLTLLERRENVTGIFKAVNTNKLKGKNLLLVDDVITTGATISACAHELKNLEPANIYGVSAAIADY